MSRPLPFGDSLLQHFRGCVLDREGQLPCCAPRGDRHGTRQGAARSGGGRPGGEHMSRQRKNWTDAEDDLLRHLADSGARSREIGERIGRSESAVRNRMKFLRISRRGGHVRKYASWSEEELTALRELDGKGILLTEISARLGRDRTSVAAKARALGLWHKNPLPDTDIPAGTGNPEPKRPARVFSEIEKRRIRRFLARGDTLADIARQMRCEVADIRRI